MQLIMRFVYFYLLQLNFVLIASAAKELRGREEIKGPVLIGGRCSWSGDCVDSEFGNSLCTGGICVCNKGYVQKKDLTKCLPIRQLSEGCEEPQQCTNGNGGQHSDCRFNGAETVCTCRVEAVEAAGKCYLLATKVGDPCEEQQQCTVTLGPSNCVGGKCRCSVDFVPSSDLRKCLEKRYLGSPCEDRTQCEHLFPNRASCHLVDPEDPTVGKHCACNPGFINPPPINNMCYQLALLIGQSCAEHEIQCDALNDARCVADVCSCDATHIPSSDRKSCLERRENLSDNCGEDVQCTIENSACEAATCQCKVNEYVATEIAPNLCLKIINNIKGDACDEDVQCKAGIPFQHSHCFTVTETGLRYCDCTTGSATIPPNHRCYKIITRVNEECEITQQCTSALGPLSTCSSAKVCECTFGGVPSTGGDKCLPIASIGDPCENHAQCPGYPMESQCLVGECKCNDGFVSSNDKTKCLPIINNLGGSCDESLQCQKGIPGPLSECAGIRPDDMRCVCSSLAVPGEANNTCHKKAEFIGDACVVHMQCSQGIGNSFCNSFLCQCNPDAISTPDRRKCLKKQYLGENCVNQYECVHIPNASCHFIDPSNPKLGTCACNFGYKQPSSQNDICLPIASVVIGIVIVVL